MDAPTAAAFMQAYTLSAQHTGDRSLTRYRHDLCKMVENNEISTGPGRYALGAPNRYGNAAFITTPTVINQRWGAAHDMSSTKTEVESDLFNLRRPSARVVTGQYSPSEQDARRLTAMPEADFPHTYERLVDPPCTLRSSGWNRWEWLCQNPQENVMMPFEYQVDSRIALKDSMHNALDKRSYNDCQTIMEPAVPVARVQPLGAPQNFNDAIPGASQRIGVAPAKERTASGPPPSSGPVNPNAPLRAPLRESEGRALERIRAEQGLLKAPMPFTAHIVRS